MYSEAHQHACERHWNEVGKPLYSLGHFERMVSQLGGIQHTENVQLNKRAILVLCADNGVVAEGVTQTDSSITALNSKSIARGNACINAFARSARADVFAVDVGINTDEDCPELMRRKAAHGTRNMVKEPAMTMDEVQKSLQTGMDLVKELKEKGYQIICTGEMGIGNTTTSSAMAAMLLQKPIEEVTGRGAGLSDEGLKRKLAAIHRAFEVNRPDAGNPLDVLSKVGGLDIAVMTGVFLGGTKHEMPIVIDGFISSVAALTAAMIAPDCKQFMLASHMGREPACRFVLEKLGKSACITADLALGEGTGAAALLPLIDLALSVYHQSSTFANLQMDAYTPFT